MADGNNSGRYAQAAPAVEFSMQAVVPNFPAELHEAIVVTPELSSWAATVLPIAKEKLAVARDIEQRALANARGEASWNAVSGPSKALEADRIGLAVDYLGLLAGGENSSSYLGWIDKREWTRMVDLVAVEQQQSVQHNPALERFLDDGRFYVEWNMNSGRDSGNGLLSVRCEADRSSPSGMVVAGGYEQTTDGTWHADVFSAYDEEKDTDCRALGEFATRNEAIMALWKEREVADVRAHEMRTDWTIAESWQKATAVAAEKGNVVFGAMSEGREFDGKVLYADSVFVVQNLGRGGAAIHRTEALSRGVEVGEVLTVKYNAAGRGVIPKRQVSLERE